MCSYVGELILASYRYVVVVLELLSALLVPELAMVHGVHWVARALSTIGYVPGLDGLTMLFPPLTAFSHARQLQLQYT